MSDHDETPVATRALWRVQTAYLVRVDEVGYTAVDLSAGGVFAAGSPQLPPGTKVQVEVELPAWTLRCEGEVRWIREVRASAAMREGMGIAFSPLPDGDRDRLRELIEELKP